MEVSNVIGSSVDEPIVNLLNVKLPDNMNWSPLPNIALATIKKDWRSTQNYSAKIALLQNIEEGKYIASFSNFSRILMKPSQNGRGGYKSNEAQEDWWGRCWEARVGGGGFRITKGEAKKNGPEAECKGVH